MKFLFLLFFAFFSSSAFATCSLHLVLGTYSLSGSGQTPWTSGTTIPNGVTDSFDGAGCLTQRVITVYTTTSYISSSGTLYYTYLTSFYSNASSCPSGQSPDSSGFCKNPTCPIGKMLDASGKYCVDQVCPVGSSRDPITFHCLPIKCPSGQTLISDGTCQITCPPNSSRVDKICRYDCGHWSKSQCGTYLNSKGEVCQWTYGNLFTHTFSYGSLGSCVTSAQNTKNIQQLLPLKLSTSSLAKVLGAPDLPDYEPMPIKPYEPVVVPIPKPANVPDYVPPVEPIPVRPIPVKPLDPIPEKPINDPDYVPTIEPVTPLTPDIVPYVAPVPEPLPAPSPVPLPAPEPFPAPVPSPAPLPAPAPSPIVAPAPAPAPSPSPLPMPKPEYTFDPVPAPAPAPVIDPVTGLPAPAPAPVPVIEPMPNVAMPAVPNVLDFSIDDMDKFRYNATTMSRNILDQVDNVQNTFTNTMSILNQGFPPVQLPTGSCGSSMAFNFYGKHIDLCPPLANTSAQFAPLFQLLIFMVGLIASIKIFISGLRD